MNDELLKTWSVGKFQRAVMYALRNCHRLGKLAESPLAHCSLAEAAIILPDQTESIGRGHALRLALLWAISRLLPADAAAHPGTAAPPPSPAPLSKPWRHYLILRHHYVDAQLLPAAGQNGTEDGSVMSRLGITSQSDYAREKQRSERAVAAVLRQALDLPALQQELTEFATAAICSSLATKSAIARLLSLAAAWRGPISRPLLLKFAQREGIDNARIELLELMNHGLLLPLPGKRDEIQALPDRIRRYFIAAEPASKRQQRHQALAEHYQGRRQPLESAWHWVQTGNVTKALALIGEELTSFVRQSHVRELLSVLDSLQLSTIDQRERSYYFIYRTVALSILGSHEEAIAACEQAINMIDDPEVLGTTFSLLGMRYSVSDYPKSLLFLEKALTLLPPGHPDRLTAASRKLIIYLDQGRADEAGEVWEELERQASTGNARDRAFSLEALSLARSHQKQYSLALEQIFTSMHLWETLCSMPHVAICHVHAANILAATGEIERALELALRGGQIARRSGFSAGETLSRITQGRILLLYNRLDEATALLKGCLNECSRLKNYRGALTVYLQLGRIAALQNDENHLRGYWLAACRLAMKLGAPRTLLELFPAVHGAPDPSAPTTNCLKLPEHIAMEIAAHQGQVTSQSLMETAQLSAATARRILQRLTHLQLLRRTGQGRGTTYIHTFISTHQPAASSSPGIGQSTRDAEQEALEVAARNGCITPAMLVETHNVSRATAQRILSRLCARGQLLREGKGRASRYIPAS